MKPKNEDDKLWLEVEIQAALICNTETGINWLNIPELQKMYFRKTAFARMMEKALEESGKYEKLPNGQWRRIIYDETNDSTSQTN